MQVRTLQSANFRLALIYTALFSLSVVLLGGLMFFFVSQSFKEQLRDRILAESDQLMGDYNDDGLEELRHDIRERADSSHAHRLSYALKSPAGKALFDDIAHYDEAGWHTITTKHGSHVLTYTILLKEGYSLHIGADLDDVEAMGRAVRNSVLIVVLLTLVLSVTGGLWLSRRFLSRVDRFTRAADSIGRGSLSARLPISPANDEFDQLAITINRMLGRIETLMNEVKHVSTGIAHDMRTPLGRLRQKLEILSQKPHNADTSRMLEECMAQLDETLATFSSLLRIAEIESGSVAISPDTIDVEALLHTLCETYTPIAEAASQSLCVESHIHSPLIADRALITQLLVNLIENAIRYSGEGSHITLRASETKQTIALTVADTGGGIPLQEHASILKPFYRLDHSRHTPGSGLGLSLVAAIASLHHATLHTYDNAPGFAATIRFARHGEKHGA